jgi:hypothetical protein
MPTAIQHSLLTLLFMITLISDHVLLPHQADWSQQPELRNAWHSSVDASLLGIENRKSFRDAWRELRYLITPYNHVERARLEARVGAGMKSGRVAVPIWDRGWRLASNSTSSLITLNTSAHGLVPLDWIFLHASDPASYDRWDAVLVKSTSGTAISITSLTNSYLMGEWVRPMLFGRLVAEKFVMLNRTRGQFPVMLFSQRTVRGAVYDSFDLYNSGTVAAPLSAGEAWSGPWVLATPAIAIEPDPYDNFESYTAALVTDPLTGGPGWYLGWVLAGAFSLELPVMYDDFESYSTGAVGSPLNGGDNWDDAWVLGDAATLEPPSPSYDNFETYTAGAIGSPLADGDKWDGAWVLGDASTLEPPGPPYDDFESYGTGTISSPLDGGEFWDDEWVLGNAESLEPPGPHYDNFESYSTGSIGSPLNAGENWDGNWVLG